MSAPIYLDVHLPCCCSSFRLLANKTICQSNMEPQEFSNQSPHAGATRCQLHNLLGIHLGEVTEIPGFRFYQCPEKECPDPLWMACALCPKTNIRFWPSAINAGLPHNNQKYKQIVNHLGRKGPHQIGRIPNCLSLPDLIYPNKPKKRSRDEKEDDEEDDEESVSSEGVEVAVFFTFEDHEEDDADDAFQEHECPMLLSCEQEAAQLLMESVKFAKASAAKKDQIGKLAEHMNLMKESDSWQREHDNTRAMSSTLSLNHRQSGGALSLHAGNRYYPIRDASKKFLFDMEQSVHCLSKLMGKVIYGEDSWHVSPISQKDAVKLFLLIKAVWMMPTKVQKHVAPVFEILHVPTNICKNCKTKTDAICSHCKCFKPFDSFLHGKEIYTHRDIRRMIYRGKNSFVNVAPYPELEMIDGFAYISVADLMSHLLQTDNLPDFDVIKKHRGGSVSSLSQSAFAQNILDESVDYHILCQSWSDGFQANYSNKTNRLNPWFKTLTIELADNSQNLLPDGQVWQQTFPVAFGLEKADKRKVEARFYKEMEQLDRPGGIRFYKKDDKKWVTVRVSLAIIRGDQPERRQFCFLRSMHSHQHVGFGVLGDVKSIYDTLPSCDDCLKAHFGGEPKGAKACEKCLGWDMLKKDTTLNTYDAPSTYPPGKEKILKFCKADFSLLIKAVDEAHNNYCFGNWTKKETTNFLMIHGFPEKVIENIVSASERVILKENAEKNPHVEGNAKMLERARLDPERYKPWIHPQIWHSAKLWQVVDIPMHLLFEGIAKTLCSETIPNWLKTFNLNAPFTAAAQGLLDFIKSFDLEWCKAMPYDSEKMGSWVAENFVALAKLMPWFYSVLSKVKEEKKNDKDEIVEQFEYNPQDSKCWNAGNCRIWLKNRGLDNSGNKDEVKERVKRHQLQEGGPPKRITKKAEPRQLLLLVQSFFAMIARLMAKEVNEDSIKDAHCHVNIFLSCYSRHELWMTDNQTKPPVPTWATKGNFLSLPRLIESMQHFGPLRLMWEGKQSGEGILSFVKPELTSGLRLNWNINCMKKLLRTMMIDFLFKSKEVQDHIHDLAPELLLKRKPKHSHCRYREIEQLASDYGANRPISGFVTKQGIFKALVGGPSVCGTHTLSHVKFESIINGMSYHVWMFDPEEKRESYQKDEIAHHVLFLPELCSSGFMNEPTGRGVYAIITENWLVLNKDMEFSLPSVESWFDV